MGPQTIVITGASDGIGAAAARTMKARGENIVLVGRDPKKMAAVAAELHAPHHVADFAELDQVRALAADLDASYPQINVLANNAGGMMGPRTVTADGFTVSVSIHATEWWLADPAAPAPRQRGPGPPCVGQVRSPPA